MATTLIGKAALFAIERHGEQLYGRKPYHVHLNDAVGVLRRFIDWDDLPQEFVDATWLHDIIEDTKTTREEISVLFGSRVAELVHAVSNEPGPNRKARHALTYPKVRSIDRAITIKLADRIANVEQAVSHDRFGRPPQNLFWMYAKEWNEFQKELRNCCLGEGEVESAMWQYLSELMHEGHEKGKLFKEKKAWRGEV